jgi:hypothetical protein
MATFKLTVEAPSGKAGWNVAWWMGGEPMGQPFFVGEDEARPVLAAHERFARLFDGETRPLIDPAALHELGAGLYENWFAPAWRLAGRQIGLVGHDLVIQSTDGRVLDLPWELVELHPGLPVGCDAGWSVRRLPLPASAPEPLADEPLAAGPLRVVFLAAAPVDQPQLDFEREALGHSR